MGFVSICFSPFYLFFTFIYVSATIFAMQQLSDTHRRRYSYTILHKMGVNQRQLHTLPAKQIAIYFIIPLVLLIVHLLPIIRVLDELFEMTYASVNIFIHLRGGMLFFLAVCGCYYMMAYFGCRRNINQI